MPCRQREFNKNRDMHKDFLKNVWLVIQTFASGKTKFFSYILKEAEKHLRLGNLF